MRRHGRIYGFVSPKQRGIRAWRVYCKPSKGGCGHAPGLRLKTRLVHSCLNTLHLWRFLKAWLDGRSVKGAWERAGSPLSLDCAYRILKRLQRAQGKLRPLLWGADPPGPQRACGSPLHELLGHLRGAYGTQDPIRRFQWVHQQPFPGI